MLSEGLQRTEPVINPSLPDFVIEDILKYFSSRQEWDGIPEFMIRDVFTSYYVPDQHIRYKAGQDNYWWYSMLNECQNYLLKMVTKHRRIYSFIIAKHILKAIKDAMQNHDQQNSGQSFSDMIEQMKNEMGGDQQQQGDGSGEQKMEQFKQDLSQEVDQAMKNAKKELDDAQAVDDFNEAGSQAGKHSSLDDWEQLKSDYNDVKEITVDRKSINRFLKRAIKGMKEGLSGNTVPVEGELFEADSIDDFPEYHRLAHKMMLLESTVTEQVPAASNFDVYIDVSLSMRNNSNVTRKAKVTRIKMACLIAKKMDILGCLNDVYKFNSGVYSIRKENILKLTVNGGTKIETVMQKIKHTGNPSLIITDGQDSWQTVPSHAYVISIDVGPNSSGAIKMAKNRKFCFYKNGQLSYPKVK